MISSAISSLHSDADSTYAGGGKTFVETGKLKKALAVTKKRLRISLVGF